jgi:hypothetical protein
MTPSYLSPAPSHSPARIAQADGVILLSVLGAGSAAAYLSDPMIWPITAIVAGALWIAIRRPNASAVAQPGLNLDSLPVEISSVVRATMAQLPNGGARNLLRDLLIPARLLLAPHESAFDSTRQAEMRAHVVELVEDACAIAIDLGRVETLSASTAPADVEIGRRYQTARELFAKRLRDAASALSVLYASGVDQGTPASDRVAEIVMELRSEVSARSAARRELDELLRAI